MLSTQFYKQIDDCTMGGPFLVIFSNIHMTKIEQQTPVQPKFYKRYNIWKNLMTIIQIQITPLKLIKLLVTGLDKGEKPLRCARFFGRACFSLQKKKKSLDLQVFSQIG